MQASRRLLAQLLVVAGAAACGNSDSSNTGETGNAPGAGGSGTAGSSAGKGGSGTAGGTAGSGTAGSGTAGTSPVPSGTYPSCAAGSSAGVGLCCTYLTCYTPPETEACAPAATAPICHGVGSGSCDCGPTQGPFKGPFGDATAFAMQPGCAMGKKVEDGACCYLVPIEGCEGRPLFVEGRLRTAALADVDAWA